MALMEASTNSGEGYSRTKNWKWVQYCTRNCMTLMEPPTASVYGEPDTWLSSTLSKILLFELRPNRIISEKIKMFCIWGVPKVYSRRDQLLLNGYNR